MHQQQGSYLQPSMAAELKADANGTKNDWLAFRSHVLTKRSSSRHCRNAFVQERPWQQPLVHEWSGCIRPTSKMELTRKYALMVTIGRSLYNRTMYPRRPRTHKHVRLHRHRQRQDHTPPLIHMHAQTRTRSIHTQTAHAHTRTHTPAQDNGLIRGYDRSVQRLQLRHGWPNVVLKPKP